MEPDGKRLPVIEIADCPEEIWDKTIVVNLTCVFLCMKYEIRQILKQKRAAIVNTSSVGAFKAVPGFAAYNASKTGLFGLSKTAALECASSGIRVNVICPGPTERTLLFDYLTGASPEMKEQMSTMIPVGRVATPEKHGRSGYQAVFRFSFVYYRSYHAGRQWDDFTIIHTILFC